MSDTTVRERKPTAREEWMFELIAALKDEVLDLRMTRDAWMNLALIQHKEAHDREVK